MEASDFFAGTACANLVRVPLFPRDSRQSWVHMLGHTQCRALVTSEKFAEALGPIQDELDDLEHVIVRGHDYEDWLTGQSDIDPDPPVDPDDYYVIRHTGGTTGRAKGVMLSHQNLWFCGGSSNEASYVPGFTTAIVPLPLSHAFGLITTIVGLHTPEPASAVLMRWFDPTAWLQLVQDQRVQRGAVVPSMVQILLGAPLEEYDLSSLRYLNCGAAPLSVEVANEFERRVPGVELCEGYGSTEAGAVVAVNRLGARKLGSVGPPIPGCEVRVVDEEDQALPVGGVGEICVRSPGVMLGYWKSPELSNETLKGGWLHTGDMGKVDDDGFVFIVDRKKDLIIRGGFNVFPRDVEDVLLEHPAVALAGVVGKPDERHGEEVVAFVQLRPGQEATDEELIAFAKDRLGAYKYPREVSILPMVPLTPVGKVDRKSLRTMLQA